ncbi:efflux RND transporter periplasmic adaptor subunit [uncultured Cocleimonas sp.]|uniref:efflux RND transporter periplasmic adaptor subunit n=1 Tax=uncultured Cocleimonas sp. TaxID=1051587 RepID=UPI002608C1C4|nr:HlyD family efflux transporter periplasmic adaptor subunit [uncultured Cocleimonas sp.]
MLKIILPILVLAAAFTYAKHLKETAPEAVKRPFVKRLTVVEVETLKPTQYTVNIEASGTVNAGTQTNLVAEVSGRIVNISDNFLEGNYFDKDQTLLEIDKSNYINAVDIAKSDVAANDASLKQIKAEEDSNKQSIQLAQQNLALGRKELARVKSLLNKKLISRSLVDAEDQKINQLQQRLQELRGLQTTFASKRNATQAKINSTKARLKQETLNLSRTQLKAPYRGRVLTKNVDFGQYVSVGTVLGEIYATDYVNVELPLSLSQYELLGMPEAFRNKSIDTKDLPEVVLTNPDSLKNDKWLGRVVRTGAALDSASRQINVIVRVDDPYEAKEGISTPIRIGQYLKATIKGRTFKNVFVLPSIAVIYNREIRLLEDGKIKIEPVKVIWNTNSESVIEANPDFIGKQIITTNLTQAIDGMEVITLEEQNKLNKKNTLGNKRKGDKESNKKDKKGEKQ